MSWSHDDFCVSLQEILERQAVCKTPRRAFGFDTYVLKPQKRFFFGKRNKNVL